MGRKLPYLKWIFSLAAGVFCLIALSSPAAATTYYVSPLGSDAWSGQLAAPNSSHTDGPFATLQAAQMAARNTKNAGQTTVFVRAGTYYLQSALDLSELDSGMPGSPNIWSPYSGEIVKLSAGAQLSSTWVACPKNANIYYTDIPSGSSADFDFSQLYVNDRRAFLARYPHRDANGSDVYLYNISTSNSSTSLAISKPLLDPNWAKESKARVNVVAGVEYFNEILPITAIGGSGTTLTLGDSIEAQMPLYEGNRFFISGLLSEMAVPGDWYLDSDHSHTGFCGSPPYPSSSTRRLYYYSKSIDGPPSSWNVVVPKLDHLVDLRGANGKNIHDIRITGFTFSHAAAATQYPALRTATDGAIRITNGNSISIDNNVITNVDGFGIWLHLNSNQNKIFNNRISHTGAGGILLTSHLIGYQYLYDSDPADLNAAPLGNQIYKNEISLGGEIRIAAAGILLDTRPASTVFSAGNLVAYNLIHDMTRQGVFGFGNQAGNIVYGNQFYNLVTKTADAGAINFAIMNNISAPTIIQNNSVNNVVGLLNGAPGVNNVFGGVGIYLDWASSHIRVIGNSIANTNFASLLSNAGTWNYVSQNSFYNDLQTEVMANNIWGMSVGMTLENNVIAHTKNPSSYLVCGNLPSVSNCPTSSSPNYLIDDFLTISDANFMPFLKGVHFPTFKSVNNTFWDSNGAPFFLLRSVATNLNTLQSYEIDSNSKVQTEGNIAVSPLTDVGPGASEPSDLPDLNQMSVEHYSYILPGTASASPPAVWKPTPTQNKTFFIYARFSTKNSSVNPSLTLNIKNSGSTAQVKVANQIPLGVTPSAGFKESNDAPITYFGVYLGSFVFSSTDNPLITLNWDPGSDGAVPSEIDLVESKDPVNAQFENITKFASSTGGIGETSISSGSRILFKSASLTFGSDGVLSISDPVTGSTLWSAYASSTNCGFLGTSCTMSFQSNGNLVLRDANDKVYWTSGTSGAAGAQLQASANPPYLAIGLLGQPPLWSAYSATIPAGGLSLQTTGVDNATADFGNGLQMSLLPSGDLVLYSGSSTAGLTQVWHSGTAGKCSAPPCTAAMQVNGRLVLRNGIVDPAKNSSAYWVSHIGHESSNQLVTSATAPYLSIILPSGFLIWSAFNNQVSSGVLRLETDLNAETTADFGNGLRLTLLGSGDLAAFTGSAWNGLNQVWHSGTAGACTTAPCSVSLQPNGNLVLRNGVTNSFKNNSAYWISGTVGNASNILFASTAAPYLAIGESATSVVWAAYGQRVNAGALALQGNSAVPITADFGNGFQLSLQSDGDIVASIGATWTGLTQVWHSNTSGSCASTPCSLKLQSDGNLVLQSPTAVLWTTAIPAGNGRSLLTQGASTPYLQITDSTGVLWTP